MNLALIHEKQAIQSFWEKRIEKHSQVSGTEDTRMKGSALSKLRGEWVVRLEKRMRHLKSFSDESAKRARAAQQLEAGQKEKKEEEVEQKKEEVEKEEVEEEEEVVNNTEENKLNGNVENEVNDNMEVADTEVDMETQEDTEEVQSEEPERSEDSKEQAQEESIVETEINAVEENIELPQNGELDSEMQQAEKPEIEIEATDQE